ncbi:MAG TPA: ABC transporter substrate-binding protein [Dehalococcoidia bacterium]|nr:ABC transporter substrate-binding protein [Dehalococcoidia bacterium]
MRPRGARLAAAVALLILAAPLIAEAQPAGKVARIGYLGVASPAVGGPYRKAFREGLRELGWIEGQNLFIEERWADGTYDTLPALAAELVRRKVDVIVASAATAAVRAAQQATSTIPIVMTVGIDPVEQGLISSVRQPGGNITGLAWEPDSTIASKYLEFLKSLSPGLRRVGVLFDRAEPIPGFRRVVEQTAVKLGLALDYVGIEVPSDIEKAFAVITRRGAQSVLIYGSVLLAVHQRQIAALAVQHKLPAIYVAREAVEAGGLISYGPSIADLYARAASYVDKILKGANPADLPVEQPTRFELVINLRTAKAIGLTIPPSLFQRADRIIE